MRREVYQVGLFPFLISKNVILEHGEAQGVSFKILFADF